MSISTVLQLVNRVPLTVEYKSPVDLKPYLHNARTHTKRQVKQIAESIRVFGFTNPVLVDRNNRIIAGHGRVEAAKLIGMTEVPTIRLDDLSEEQIQAYVIADNRLAENAGWDKSILAIELQNLLSLDCADFDVTITGFEVAEIDQVLEEAKDAAELDDPIPEPLLDRAPVTEPGDIWLLGRHHIICGNALHEATYRSLMHSRRAAMVFTDPPYNVRIEGNATGNGAIHHREFAMASGEMSELEFLTFLNNILRLLSTYSAPGSLHFLCIDWRHAADLIAAGKQNLDAFLNLCVWVKDRGGMGSLYRSQHELVLVFRKGKGPHRNNIQLGKFGRNRTNVWEYPAIQTLSKQSDEGNLLALHPTVKPVAMVADAILDCTARGETVLDAFLGSGTTLMAAERVGRICCGIEIDPIYVDVAIRRWQNYTGERALHAESKRSFDEIAAAKVVEHA
ncbi:MAG: site-specific DNA-methyltransferase [Acidobacteriota bacterium]|nr:site-specific DNA-methyltransferase [Acidobacteriota bacterium]